MYAIKGENAPENPAGSKARELLNYVKDNGLCFSTLCEDFDHSFGNAEEIPVLIERSKRILDLAKELDCNIVTTHIGVVPADPTHARFKIMQEVCAELAEHTDSMDAHFAVETAPEPSHVLKGFLDSLGSK